MPEFGRHRGKITRIHVWRIRHDEIELRLFQSVEYVRAHHRHAIADAMQFDVARGQFERRIVDVGQHDLRLRKRMRARDADTPRARSEIENPLGRTTEPWRELRADQFGDRRTRDQYAGLRQIPALRKPRLADEIGRRDPMHDPALEQSDQFAPLDLRQPRRHDEPDLVVRDLQMTT